MVECMVRYDETFARWNTSVVDDFRLHRALWLHPRLGHLERLYSHNVISATQDAVLEVDSPVIWGYAPFPSS